MPATAPRPEEPLNERELRELERIGRDLAERSPRLSRDLSRDLGRGPVWRAVDDGLALLAVLVILGVLLPAGWFAAVMIVVVMGGPTLLAVRLQRRG